MVADVTTTFTKINKKICLREAGLSCWTEVSEQGAEQLDPLWTRGSRSNAGAEAAQLLVPSRIC